VPHYVLLNAKSNLSTISLQLLEWVEQSKQLELGERDYASRLDLIAKISGLHKAEQYIEKIPASYRGEIVYRTLLANCSAETNVRKAEQVFNKMKDLGFPVTIFACNQLLLLYKRVDKKKIADVLTMMEKENVKPSLFTYKLLVDTKGASKDIEGMEKVIESMQREGIEPGQMFQATIAKYYIFNGHCEKAEAIVGSIEGDDIKQNRAACTILLSLYAFLGKKDEVERIWKVCEDNPRVDEFLSAIEAFGRLRDVEKSEKILEDMSSKWKTLSPKFYNALLRVYANQNLFDKGKELVKWMKENGLRIGVPTLDALVKLYVNAGEVEKGDKTLQKLCHEFKLRPQYNTYVMLLDAYSKKGDIRNSERVFSMLRQMGYTGRIRQYQMLLHAYLHAKSPPYGFRERMKADNIFPNGAVASLIAATDPFAQKKSISELLE
jgi:pentatricopeptide repeat protein